MNMKSTLRAVFAVGILAALLFYVGTEDLIEVVRRIDLQYLVYLLLLSIVLVWASCLKWRLFVRASGHDAPMLHLMKLYMVGYFFNTFTPSFVGGDVVRSFHLGKRLENQKDAFIATFLERFTGLIAMAVLGLVFVLLGSRATAGVEIAVYLVAAATSLLALICFSERAGNLFFSVTHTLLRLLLPATLSAKVERLSDKLQVAMVGSRGRPMLILHAMGLSFIFHILTVLNVYIAARAIGWQQPDISGLFVIVPLVLLVSMAPITPSGIGIQEGAFLYFIQRIGGTHAEGLAVGLLLRAKILFLGAVGGLLWLTIRDKFKATQLVSRGATTASNT